METLFAIIVIFLIVLFAANLGLARLAEMRNPPIGKFLECDGVRLHFIDRGDPGAFIDRGDPGAPCVVLFHGNGGMIQDFTISGLVDVLARRNRVLCFDRPGFGYSERPRLRIWTATAQGALLANALDQLGVHNPVLLGHSWGTLVALALALRNDRRIAGLVLASGYYFAFPRWDVWIASSPAIPILGDIFRYTIAPIISWPIIPGMLRKLFAPRAVPEEFTENFPVSLAVRPEQLRATAEESALLFPAATGFQSRYSNLRCPVHIFHGTQDKVIEAEQARRLERALPHSLLHLVQGAGHMVTYADTKAIAQAVAELNAGSEQQ
jgi:pimeloyl-ACP methyl ester carboxylesterase